MAAVPIPQDHSAHAVVPNPRKITPHVWKWRRQGSPKSARFAKMRKISILKIFHIRVGGRAFFGRHTVETQTLNKSAIKRLRRNASIQWSRTLSPDDLKVRKRVFDDFDTPPRPPNKLVVEISQDALLGEALPKCPKRTSQLWKRRH